MSIVEFFTAATVIALLIAWLRWANKQPSDQRIEALAIGLGWFGFAFVLAGKWAGSA